MTKVKKLYGTKMKIIEIFLQEILLGKSDRVPLHPPAAYRFEKLPQNRMEQY